MPIHCISGHLLRRYRHFSRQAARIAVFVCQGPVYTSLMIYFYLFSDKMAAVRRAALENPGIT